jgi:hypothetical protein
MKKMSNNIADYPDSDLLHPGRYIKSAEVKVAGRPVPLTIVRIEPRHELKGNKGASEFKPCLFFKETEKGTPLNKTNTKRLADCLGKDPRKWIGCKVVLCVERVDGFGKKVDAIRVDEEATRAANRAKRTAEPEPAQEDPFPMAEENSEPDELELSRQAAEAEQA